MVRAHKVFAWYYVSSHQRLSNAWSDHGYDSLNILWHRHSSVGFLSVKFAKLSSAIRRNKYIIRTVIKSTNLQEATKTFANALRHWKKIQIHYLQLALRLSRR